MRPAVKISLIYVCFSVLYIVLSDWIILKYFSDHSIVEASKLQTTKGIVFVLSTGALLFLVTNMYFKRLSDSNSQKSAMHEINNSIFEVVNDSIGIIDHSGHFIYFNKSLIELVQPNGIMTSKSLHIDQITQKQIRRHTASFLQDIQEEDVHVVETEDKKWVKIFLRKITVSTGIDYIFLKCEDITDQRYKEIKLIESEQDLLSIFNKIPFGIIFFDGAGKLKFFNSKSQFLLEFGSKEVSTREFPSVINISEKAAFSTGWEKAINENTELHFKASIEFVSKGVHWFQFTAFPISQKEKKGHILIIDDITSQVHAEQKNLLDSKELKQEVKKRTEEIELKNKKLEESQRALTYLLEDVNEVRDELILSNKLLASTNEELEAFSYSVSHDLRAPLRSINGFSLALLEDYGNMLDDTGRDYLNRIHKGALRMGDLIDDMLVLSRISRKEMQLMEIDISVIAEEKIRELQENDPGRNVSVSIDQGIKCYGDLNLFKILFSNLLENAWKFTLRESHAEIEVGLLSDEIFVRDNGVGFDIGKKDKIFEPFQRLHSPKNYKGTGIGLAIVKRIVNRHDGQIKVISKPGSGTTFFMKFPGKNQN